MSSNNDFDDDLEIEDELDIEYEVTESKGTRVPSKIIQDKISLYFRSTIGPGEKMEKLTVDSNVPIVDLKKTVGILFGLESEDFNLIINGRTADDEDILSNYDIEEGLEILLIPISQAG
ncbi:MAG: hypothetical protein HeimC3_05740 [Candidatus Heimdallarchaeota archaeon LC_3]|nr:MAG: hypothetical protein HeimC3_05740 [Candidatus Heimdallarchaeota archaeon LC_3]